MGRGNRAANPSVAWRGGGFTSVAFSPDGQRLASTGVDQHVRVWDAKTGLEIRTLDASGRFPGVCTMVAFSPNGRRVASAYGIR